MQFIFVSVLLIIFIATFVYFWINDVETNKMDVVFTIVVGWLGLIIGAFFGQKFMDNLTPERKREGISLRRQISKYRNQINKISNILQEYEKIKLKK